MSPRAAVHRDPCRIIIIIIIIIIIADQSGDDREISFLFQRLSVVIQQYSVLLHDCFVKEEEE